MDRSTDGRAQAIALEMGRLASERQRLAKLARWAGDTGQSDVARRNLVRLAILDLRFASLVRERLALLGRT
jgi:hypothetical protein